MSDFNDDDFDEDFDDQPTITQNPMRARMKQLEQETKQLRKQNAELLGNQRELAFVRAGIDPASPQAKYFVKGYDGDLTPEAIRQAAEEAQLITPQNPQQDLDKAAWQQSNRIAAGAETASSGPSWKKRVRDASSPQELSDIFAEAQAQGVDLAEM